MDLVKQEHWDKNYETSVTVPEYSAESNAIIEWIYMLPALKQGGSCIEIGVYPGGYLNIFGKLGYTISGIDLTPRVTELDSIFRSRNYAVGEILSEDFFRFKPKTKYDIVYSLGFIEHFVDYKDVIAKHCDLVADDGILLITVPNFRGKLQHLLHRILDNANLKRHNLKSMNPNEWETVLIENNFEIIKQGYIGKFDFWVDIKNELLRKRINRILRHIVNPVLRKMLSKPSPSYSPFCGIIARKKK